MSIVQTMEANDMAASIKAAQRTLKSLECSIGNSQSTILIMRKRRVLLRQRLRREIARLEKIQQKGALRD